MSKFFLISNELQTWPDDPHVGRVSVSVTRHQPRANYVGLRLAANPTLYYFSYVESGGFYGDALVAT